MTSHRRVKDIAYDADDLDYDEDESAPYDQYTEEDKQNFAELTPVVQAHLVEAQVKASVDQIQEALYHYYWDVAKSVDYLKKQNTPKTQPAQKQTKPKSKFDEAADKVQIKNGKFDLSALVPGPHMPLKDVPMEKWMSMVDWNNIPPHLVTTFTPERQQRPIKLMGGSSKLAKLAEERRRKAESLKAGVQDRTNEASVSTTVTSLDRLSLNKAEKRPSDTPETQRRYPSKKKKEPTPPPAEEPEPEVEPVEPLPDIRAEPSAFGRILSSKTKLAAKGQLSVQDVFAASKPTQATPKPAAQPVKPKAQLANAKQLWGKARTTQRPFASFVVAGHVDHGKSTLMGRLLLDTGAVQQRDIDKFKKQAAEIGKESFALAWVMDTGSEERERGVTVDIAQHNFSTAKADFTIIDAPGHRDFIPNMLSGASMADIVVLVVDANQLDSGIKGQTREHIQLAYGVGIRKVVVAVNKLDASNPAWDQQLFSDVKDQIARLLRQVGFVEKNIRYVPCSGLNGENVAKPAPKDSPAAEVGGGTPSLVAALETFTHDDAASYAKAGGTPTQQEKAVTTRSLRMQVADVYRGGIQNPLSVSGRIAHGDVVEGQAITILPSGDQAVVKGIERAGEGTEWAVALQIVSLHLDGDLETLNRNLRAGDLISSTSQPPKLIKTITAKVQVLDTILPQAVELHYGRLHITASVKRLVETIDSKGAQLKKSPRSLKAGQVARIDIALGNGAPLEPEDRIILRSDGDTIALGIIESVIA
ncbi:hypothetical protein AMS68_007411 [Peltaster fructicola]|uniref:Elongation factor 1-alpha n=1 Tax=Peltaster fructicola TaxID=286661 RepID=A0A6H0Y4F3_9PEZI|nr:hypothetical protein AMS68_007411 [Peltaster fructicola]